MARVAAVRGVEWEEGRARCFLRLEHAWDGDVTRRVETALGGNTAQASNRSLRRRGGRGAGVRLVCSLTASRLACSAPSLTLSPPHPAACPRRGPSAHLPAHPPLSLHSPPSLPGPTLPTRPYPARQSDRVTGLFPCGAPRRAARRRVARVGPDVVGSVRTVPVGVRGLDVSVRAPIHLRVAPAAVKVPRGHVEQVRLPCVWSRSHGSA